MNQSDRAAFQSMLTLTAEQYGKPMSTDLIGLYFEGLRHLSLEDIRAALTSHVRNTEIGQFMPKISDIIRAARGTSEGAAYRAFAQISSRFNGGSGECDDPVALAVVRDMGGLAAIGRRDAQEWQSFGLKDFVKRYQIYKECGDPNETELLPTSQRAIEDK